MVNRACELPSEKSQGQLFLWYKSWYDFVEKTEERLYMLSYRDSLSDTLSATKENLQCSQRPCVAVSFFFVAARCGQRAADAVKRAGEAENSPMAPYEKPTMAKGPG